jgi:hypothetical protein
MFELKTIAKEAVAAALAKAERYRLLNEPQEAESICRDILAIEPDRADAQVILLLALTDQFGPASVGRVSESRGIARKLGNEYDREYYEAIVCERWGKAQLRDGAPGHVVYGWLRDAMHLYEQAEKIEAGAHDDAILRWNACVRLLQRHPHLIPREERGGDDLLEGGDEMPR